MVAKLKQANKIYETPAGEVMALNKTDLELNEGELLLIIGPSGSGKTTLLSLIGCLINPTEGEVEIDGKSIKSMNAKEMSQIRLNTIGFVFQQFNLLAPLSGYDNVAFPLTMQNFTSKEIKTTQAYMQPKGTIATETDFPTRIIQANSKRNTIHPKA